MATIESTVPYLLEEDKLPTTLPNFFSRCSFPPQLPLVMPDLSETQIL